MYATDFEYADKRLSDFNCVTCYINNSTGVSELDIGCDITFNTIKNNHSSIQYKTSTSYDNIYTTSFEIMKNPCSEASHEDMYMTYEEVRKLVKWLNRREHRKFKLLLHDNEIPDVCYYGSFNVKQIMVNDRVAGLSLTFTSNAPYGFGEEVDLEFDIASSDEYFYIHGDSDEIGLIYPNISVTCKQDGELKITNLTTGTVMTVANCSENETIYINGEHKIITSDNEAHKTTTLYSDFEYEYLDILVDDSDFNENKYEVSMPCEIKINYSPIRKVGVN